ncbi:MAG: trypsin-like serine protease [Bdellovibrio sp.]|nr:trypsin-like serine protease [Bdellovibrio sp.]
MKSCSLLITLLLTLSACQPAPQNAVGTDDSAAVIGGQPIQKRNTLAARSVVLLELLDADGFSPTFCTATLVGPNTILTAAHCFDKKLIKSFVSFRVVFANSISDSLIGSKPAEIRAGVFYKNHPEYNSTGEYDHDIAVGIFKGSIPSGFAIMAMDTDKIANYGGKNLYVYGYGKSRNYTGKLNEDLRAHTGVLNRGVLKVTPSYTQHEDRYLIVPESQAHICQGDSGGPQFYQSGEVLKIVGVTSANMGPVLPNGRQSCTAWSQATKVAPFYTWIKSIEKKVLQ